MCNLKPKWVDICCRAASHVIVTNTLYRHLSFLLRFSDTVGFLQMLNLWPPFIKQIHRCHFYSSIIFKVCTWFFIYNAIAQLIDYSTV